MNRRELDETVGEAGNLFAKAVEKAVEEGRFDAVERGLAAVFEVCAQPVEEDKKEDA